MTLVLSMDHFHLPRADRITRTGVIDPYYVRQISPVDVARMTINPFLQSVRGNGPAVVEAINPQAIAAAAQQVAEQFKNGGLGAVQIGRGGPVATNLKAMRPGNDLISRIAAAAKQLARGIPTVMQEPGARAIVVRPALPRRPVVDPSGPNVVAQVARQAPSGRPFFNAGQAMYRQNLAFAQGNIWQQLAARQYVMRLRYPGALQSVMNLARQYGMRWW